MVKLNQEHIVADLRAYINIARLVVVIHTLWDSYADLFRPQYTGVAYTLMTTFPNKELTDGTATITRAGLDGAVVIQRQE